MPLTPLSRRPLAALAAVAAVAVPVAGCGGGSSSAGGGDGADPATSVPASTPIYIEATVQPDGDLETNIQTVGRKLLNGKDPAQELLKAVDKELHEDGGDFQKDIEPWLGERAAIAITDLRDEDSDGAAVIASKDDDKARAFLDKEKDTEEREYRGVTYRLETKPEDKGDFSAAAVVDGRVLLGTEKGLKAAIDATKGSSLAEVKQFEEARDAVEDDGLGFLYVDPRRVFDAVSLEGDASNQQAAELVKGMLASSGLRSVGVGVDVERDAIVADTALVGLKSLGAKDGDAAGAAADVPADAWLSVGVGDVGGTAQRALRQLGSSGAGAGVDPQALLRQLKSGLGVDVEKDLLSWMGDAALYVAGDSPSTLRGALVVESKDPAASKRAIATLRRLMPRVGARALPVRGLPGGATGFRLSADDVPGGGIQIAAKDDRFAIAIGRGALIDALAADETLGSTEAYKTAAGLLDGAKPSFFLNTPKAVDLAEAMSAGDADFQKAKPTLDALGPAAAGGESEDDVTHVKMGISVP